MPFLFRFKYPLVNCPIWKDPPFFMGKLTKWWFSIAMGQFTREYQLELFSRPRRCGAWMATEVFCGALQGMWGNTAGGYDAWNAKKGCRVSRWGRFVALSTALKSTLWWTNIAMERSTIFNGKIHYKWPFSIAMLVHQRVTTIDLELNVDIWKNPKSEVDFWVYHFRS